MKKTTFTTKVISIILSAVCAVSALTIVGTVSTAAAVKKSTETTSVAVATETANSVKPTEKATEKATEAATEAATVKPTEKKEISVLDDPALSFVKSGAKETKKVGLQMVKAFLEKVIDQHFGKTAYGAVAVGIKNVMKDLLFEEEKQPNKDTEIIREDISRLSDQISSNHAEALAIFEKLEKQIGVESFKNRLHEVKTDYTYVAGKVSNIGGDLEYSADRVIDEATYNKFKAILSSSEIDSAKLSRNLLSVSLDVAPNSQESLDATNAAAVKAYLDKNSKSALLKYREYQLSAQRVSNADCNFSKAVDYNTTIKRINTVNDDVYQTCLMDYTTLLTVYCMEYKVTEYEHQGKSDLNARLAAIMQNINDASKSINRIAQMNQAIKATNSSLAVAKVKIGKTEKTFSNFDEAWATAVNSGSNVTVTLLADVKGDAARGLNLSKFAKGTTFNSTNGLNAAKTVVLDLNNHTIDLCGSGCTAFTATPGADFTILNGTVKNGGKIFEFTDKKNNDKTNVTINGVTFDNFKKGGFSINAGDKFELTMKFSTVKNVAAGRGFYSENKLKGIIINCVFEDCHNDKPGGAMWLNRADKLTFKYNTFKNNTSDTYAGALYVDGGKMKITGCSFISNNASKGHGGAVYTDADTVMDNCTFTNNVSYRNGGGVYVANNSKMVLKNSKFTGNNGKEGAAIYLGSLFTTHHEFENVTITGNNGCNAVFAETGRKFKCDAGDIDLKGTVIINDNIGENVHLSHRSGKAMFFTTESFNAKDSKISISSNHYDIAVVSLKNKAHASAFTGYGKKIYRGTLHNYTLYLG